MEIKWFVTKSQYAAALPKIRQTLRWMDKLGKGASYKFEIKFEYHSCDDDWWMFINGCGCGATYVIKKGKKQWRLL